MNHFIRNFILITASAVSIVHAQPLVYEGGSGFGGGKHIVFLAGDHEYRSEESLPAMARILAKHHGFKCTVLFNVDPDDGTIVPGNNNMPGMEALATADLAVIFLRFQDFPDVQMQHIEAYLNRAGPVVGMRTATHAFNIPEGKKFSKYSFRYPGKDYELGFGRQVLGETWVSHYGKNHVMSTRLDIVKENADHPILRGVTEPWAQCGGYWVVPKADSQVLAMAQPLESMKKDAPDAEDKKPCPGAWVRSYEGKDEAKGRVFTTTYGASEDLLDDDYRRMLINACVWAVGLEDQITPTINVDLVGPYHPVTYSFGGHRKGVKPSDLAGFDAPIMSPEKPFGK